MEIKLNPKIYALDVIYSAAYVLLDRAYFVLDGDPEKEIIITINPKTGHETEKIKADFYDELVNYSVYKSQVEKNGAVRQMIVERALMSNMTNHEGNKDDAEIK